MFGKKHEKLLDTRGQLRDTASTGRRRGWTFAGLSRGQLRKGNASDSLGKFSRRAIIGHRESVQRVPKTAIVTRLPKRRRSLES